MWYSCVLKLLSEMVSSSWSSMYSMNIIDDIRHVDTTISILCRWKSVLGEKEKKKSYNVTQQSQNSERKSHLTTDDEIHKRILRMSRAFATKCRLWFWFCKHSSVVVALTRFDAWTRVNACEISKISKWNRVLQKRQQQALQLCDVHGIENARKRKNVVEDIEKQLQLNFSYSFSHFSVSAQTEGTK